MFRFVCHLSLNSTQEPPAILLNKPDFFGIKKQPLKGLIVPQIVVNIVRDQARTILTHRTFFLASFKSDWYLSNFLSELCLALFTASRKLSIAISLLLLPKYACPNP